MENKEVSWLYHESKSLLKKVQEERHSYTRAQMYELSAWMRDFEEDFKKLMEKYKHEDLKFRKKE